LGRDRRFKEQYKSAEERQIKKSPWTPKGICQWRKKTIHDEALGDMANVAKGNMDGKKKKENHMPKILIEGQGKFGRRLEKFPY